MTGRNRRRCALGALILVATWLVPFVAGCGPSGPGLENKPPQPGGPKASSRRPPGETNAPQTR